MGQWTHPETQLQVLIRSALTEYWHSGWEVGHSVPSTSELLLAWKLHQWGNLEQTYLTLCDTHDLTNLLDVTEGRNDQPSLIRMIAHEIISTQDEVKHKMLCTHTSYVQTHTHMHAPPHTRTHTLHASANTYHVSVLYRGHI